MAKQRQYAVPAAVMHLAEPYWQEKSRRALLQVNSRVMRGVLLRAKWQAQAKLLVTAADSPSPSSQRLRRAGWRLPLLEAQD